MTPTRLALVAALLLPTAAVAQQSSAPNFTIDTKLTVVDVTVTDKNGRPVHGLKPGDFVIKEDGKPQPIKNFDEYGAAAPTTPAAPKLPPDVYTNIPSGAPAGGNVNLLLFSQLGPSGDVLYAKLKALKYLQTAPPGTRIAVLDLENGVRIVQDVTTDRDLQIAAVNGITFRPVAGATFVGVIDFDIACEVANQQSRVTIAALRQIAAAFAGVPGRKDLIWFTHGIPWLTDPIQFLSRPKFACLDDDTPQLQATYGMLSASQVAISTVDPRGVQVFSIDKMATPDAMAADFLNRQLNQESITQFADNTGGAAYSNRNDVDGEMGEAIAANSDYYAISYVPPLAGYDGKYHTIDVKVDRPDLQLSYRKGYTSLDLARLNTVIESSRDAKGAASAEPALPPAVLQFRAQMAHGAVPSTEFVLAARIAPAAQPATPPIQGDLNPKLKPGTLVRYDVVYAIPPGQIALREDPDGTRKGSVDFVVIAYGEDGVKLNALEKTADINLKPAEVAAFQQDAFRLPMQLDLPPGKVFVRVGALDVLSGKAGTLEVPQTVAGPAPAAKP